MLPPPLALIGYFLTERLIPKQLVPMSSTEIIVSMWSWTDSLGDSLSSSKWCSGKFREVAALVQVASDVDAST